MFQAVLWDMGDLEKQQCGYEIEWRGRSSVSSLVAAAGVEEDGKK